MFFFSSRRRHTRLVRDWSSDVCSSDLCFYPKSTAPLNRHADMRVLAIDDLGQVLANAVIDVNKAAVTGAIVVQHRSFYGG